MERPWHAGATVHAANYLLDRILVRAQQHDEDLLRSMEKSGVPQEEIKARRSKLDAERNMLGQHSQMLKEVEVWITELERNERTTRHRGSEQRVGLHGGLERVKRE